MKHSRTVGVRRRALALLACAAVGISTAAACGSSGSESGAASGSGESGNADAASPATLQFWTINLKEGYQSYIQSSIDTYTKDHPGINVEWTDIPDFAKTESKLLAAIAGGESPDVVNVTPFILPKFASTKSVYAIEDLTDDISAVQSKYVPALWDAGVIDGKAYAIPYYGSISSLIYNTDLFEKAGLDPDKAPTSWEEVFEDAKIIYEKTGVSGFAQTLDDFDDAGNPSDILAGEAGATLLNEDSTKAAFNTPEAAKFLDNYVTGMKEGWINKISATGGVMDAAKALGQQQTAMVFLGPWILRWLKDNTSAEVYQNFRVAHHPKNPGGGANGFLQNFAIPQGSKNPKQALDFAQYMASTALDLAHHAAVVPALKAQTEDPYFQSSPELKVLVNQEMTFYWPKVPSVAQLFEALRNEFQAAYLGEKTAVQALDDAAKQWDEILASDD